MFRATAKYTHETRINMLFLITFIAIFVKSLSKVLEKHYVYKHSAMRFRDDANPLKSLENQRFEQQQNALTKSL